jgi:hypothetical protein
MVFLGSFCLLGDNLFHSKWTADFKAFMQILIINFYIPPHTNVWMENQHTAVLKI